MSLLQQIKEASVNARKNKEPTAVFLVTLYAEAAKVGKDKRNGETTDEETIQILKKFKIGAESNIQYALAQNSPNAQHQIDQSNMEILVLNQYLPTLMSETELTIKIQELVNQLEDRSIKSLGKVMAQLKNNFPGLYDGALASTIAKKLLTS